MIDYEQAKHDVPIVISNTSKSNSQISEDKEASSKSNITNNSLIQEVFP